MTGSQLRYSFTIKSWLVCSWFDIEVYKPRHYLHILVVKTSKRRSLHADWQSNCWDAVIAIHDIHANNTAIISLSLGMCQQRLEPAFIDELWCLCFRARVILLIRLTSNSQTTLMMKQPQFVATSGVQLTEIVSTKQVTRFRKSKWSKRINISLRIDLNSWKQEILCWSDLIWDSWLQRVTAVYRGYHPYMERLEPSILLYLFTYVFSN